MPVVDELNYWLLGGGLTIGLAFGAVVQRSRFCIVAAVSNFSLIRDYRHIHAFILAAVVAILGTSMLEWGGWVAMAEASYRGAMFNWAGAVVGGLLFGVGTMLAGGCAGRTVVGAGEGNLGAWLTLVVFAIVAMSAYYGVLDPLRAGLVSSTAFEIEAGSVSLDAFTGLSPAWATALLATAGMLAIIFLGRGQRDKGLLWAGAIVGALVVAGWWVTGFLGRDVFVDAAPQSLRFSAPLAQSAFAVSTGQLPNQVFGMMLLLGTIVGAALMAWQRGSFRIIRPQRYHYHLVGGALMGFGAMTAGGCNIGQLSALSTCSVSAMIALVSMFTGMRLGLVWLNRDAAQAKPHDNETVKMLRAA